MAVQITVSQRGAALVGQAVFLLLIAYTYYRASLNAYEIRLYAIKIYGRVIHEFDPWFNYRATVYLAENGWQKFSHWFDYTAWYPLGRPVGTTIYPGMQVTSIVRPIAAESDSASDGCRSASTTGPSSGAPTS